MSVAGMQYRKYHETTIYMYNSSRSGNNSLSDGQFCEVIQDNGVRKGLCTSILDRDEERSAQLNESITSELCNTALYRNYIGYWKIQMTHCSLTAS